MATVSWRMHMRESQWGRIRVASKPRRLKCVLARTRSIRVLAKSRGDLAKSGRVSPCWGRHWPISVDLCNIWLRI